nr:unnamed protein product [Callosobruchus analis]
MEVNTNHSETVYKPTTKTKDGILLESDKPQNRSLFMFFTASAVNLIAFSLGTSLVWFSPVLPYLRSNDTNINPLGQPITPTQTSLISGLPYLGGAIGPFLLGKLCDIYGRRWTILFVATFSLFSFIVLAVASNIYVYYLTRTVLGGLLFYNLVVSNIYTNEIAANHNRAKLSSFFMLSHVLGLLYGYILGLFFDIRNYTLLCGAPLIMSIISIGLFVPDSPYYLAKHNESQAIASLRRLRGRRKVSRDIEVIREIINNGKKNDKTVWRQLVSEPINRRACLICVGATTLNLFSGTSAILGFSGFIFSSLGIPGNLVSVVLGLVRSIMTLVAAVIVNRFGKKDLMSLSTVGCSLSHLTVGVYFYLKSIKLEGIESFALIPAIGVLSYIGFYAVGLGISTTGLAGELFADNVRTAGNSLVFTQSALMGFVVTSAFPLVIHYLGMFWPFFMFSAICAAGLIFIRYLVPETDNKSFLEIQEILKKEVSRSTTLVWFSPVLPYLQSNDTDINPLGQPITPTQTSLIGGLPYLGGVVGPLLLGHLCDIYGRRWVILFIAILALICSIVLAFASNIYLYYLTRTILGGLLYYNLVVNNVYSNEIAENHNRAKLSSLLILSHVLGILYGYVLGLFFGVRYYTLLCAAPLVVSIIWIVLFAPDSPYYLVKNDESKAIASLRKLRGRREVSKDIEIIKEIINNVKKHDKSSWRQLISDPVNRRACLISVGAMSLNLFSGSTAIMGFSGFIFNSLGVPGNLISVGLGLVKSAMTLVASVIVSKLGKKYLMSLSTVGCSLSHLTVGIYFYLKTTEVEGIESFALVPAIAVLLYMGFYAVGLGIAATGLAGELFADNVRTAGNSLVFIQSALLGFVVTSAFPLVTYYLEMYWPFFTFSAICAAGLIFIQYLVPKTDNKSFLEIQEILKKESKFTSILTVDRTPKIENLEDLKQSGRDIYVVNYFKQHLQEAVGFKVNLTVLSTSTTLVWFSPVLPYLQSNNTNINPLGQPITPTQTSLIGGLPYLGGVVGPLLLGHLCDIYGRRWVILFIAILALICSIVLAFASNIYLYYLTRTMLGGLMHYNLVVNNVYSNEIAENHNRAKLSSLLIVSHVLGILYGYVLGLFFGIRYYTLLCAAPLVVSIIWIVLFAPDSPYYLVKHDEFKAIASLKRLRGRRKVSKDIEIIREIINNAKKHDKSSWRQLISDPVNRRKCLISVGAMSLNLLSGSTAIMGFSGFIFNSLGVSGNLVSVGLGLVKCAMTLVASVIVSRFGKKYLMSLSTVGCSLSHLTVGIYFYLKGTELEGIESFALVPAIAVLLYMGFYAVGLGIAAAGLAGELFADNVRTAGNTLVFVQSALLGFVVTSAFPLVTYYLEMYCPFFIFSAICAAGLIFIQHFVPKTDNKSFLEIQEILKKEMSRK